MSKKYEIVIGLEIHAQLSTDSKIFCACSTKFGNEPNSNICPICTGQPGVLPTLNKKVVEFAVKTSIALNMKKIKGESIFSRKQYFYPDLPKDFQVSQYDKPLAEHGEIEIEVDHSPKKIGITRIHLEEDAGKLVHVGSDRITGSDFSLVDFNRTGVPLMEIVSEPDIRSPEEAKLYVQELAAILSYLGVCDAKMEEGSLRCDANISIRPVGQKEFGTRTELKNVNSTKALKDGLTAEVERQIEALESGEKIIQETRHYDEKTGKTIALRSKEEAHDYRYFPEPDLVPLVISDAMIAEARKDIGELPQAKIKRYVEKLNLSAEAADTIVAGKDLAEFFEKCLKSSDKAAELSNWIIGSVTAYLNEKKIGIGQSKLTPKKLVAMLNLIEKGTISKKIAKDVIVQLLETEKSAEEIVKASGTTQISDESEIEKIIDEVLAKNAKSVADYKAGKITAMGFLVGQTMKATKGRANPGLVNQLLQKKLSA
ncbi:MAG: Asp-tRNA(Asn)/Glu-tRNA(Gln) amidotransferase subunit GatB [Candidatus Margulisbacteria bacterium]|nr:Asp-tRNA(Asn)/Glu-tRNA(Gln) amidotransferase subunit GatB [Candidatus Margulisiibacteriota bacterium]MBU1022305.1 Asp-tRNA(Asn)/Glu-tRNA(Gln) amidotransferase subunit GatB [Candidatus Margulisiibacteriota bacterium]MBU1729918.1 Asp-tRNA(Asn)/Glu-tRNA(Gln) amidotransferase subunit GatB [Candidatus Margulisiibacteriota bacterium]MBU1955951.1 Asp-tRNA(Asn)/Glu-tRNA(Gln) amidotransferase subunit GatB [Candidatus Margulisiibacteriota bacterium]